MSALRKKKKKRTTLFFLHLVCFFLYSLPVHMRRAVCGVGWAVGRRGYAAPKKGASGKGGKGGGGGGGASAAVGGVGDFALDDMYAELRLGSLSKADLPAWTREQYLAVYQQQGKNATHPPPPPAPGTEDKKYFKLQRRQKIKEDNERRAMGVQ